MGVTARIFALLLAMFCTSIPFSVHAQVNDAKNYKRAYNFCSPAAHKKTIEQCHYYKMVEDLYTACMHQSGFQEDSDSIAGDDYKSYLKTYNICTNAANAEAQKQCKYGEVFQGHYNSCMEELGFNPQGDSIKDSDTKSSNDTENKTTKGKDNQNDLGVGARKILDLFL